MDTMQELVLSEQLKHNSEAMHRFMRFIDLYEKDMDFTCTTDLELNLKDNMLDIFKEAHKLFNQTKGE